MQTALDASIASTEKVATTPEEPFGYGTDIKCFESIDPNAVDVDPFSTEAIAQDALHRLSTDPGAMPDDLDYGFNLVGILHKGTDRKFVVMAEGSIEQELLKDDRIAGVDALLTVTNNGKNWRATIRITPKSHRQPFTLVLAVVNGQVLFDSIGA